MDTADKHYKFINSKTGYVIFYYSVKVDLPADEVKTALGKVCAQVATKNGINQQTVYWEEIKED